MKPRIRTRQRKPIGIDMSYLTIKTPLTPNERQFLLTMAALLERDGVDSESFWAIGVHSILRAEEAAKAAHGLYLLGLIEKVGEGEPVLFYGLTDRGREALACLASGHPTVVTTPLKDTE